MKGNILRIKLLKKNSEWCDKNRVLLYACFQILVDFIEKEKPQNIVDYKHDARHRAEWKELQELYRYWKSEHPKEEKKVDHLMTIWHRTFREKTVPVPGKPYADRIVVHNDLKAFRRLCKAQDELEKTEQDMLKRLVDIRQHLWC